MAEFFEDYVLREFGQKNPDIGRKNPCFQIKIEKTIFVLFHFRVGWGSLINFECLLKPNEVFGC